jgi:outer membrane protein OmpA-like peptidoglycan-associated protein
MRILPSLFFIAIVACNNSNKQPAPEAGTGTETKAPIPASASDQQPENKSPVPVPVGKVTPYHELPAEERDYITQQEDSRFYLDALKQFNKLSPEYLEQLYGQKVSSVEELHALMRQKLIQQRRTSGMKVSQPDIPNEWAVPEQRSAQSKDADYVYVYGDMDNLGYGWPKGYDPFSGESTKPHGFPFVPEPDDPPGTDRIMVNSGYAYPSKEKNFKREKSDGYTTSTRRPENTPETLRLKPAIGDRKIESVMLQIFVDDFQAPSFSSQFKCYLNGKEAPFISNILNELKQGGPIGKMISFQLLPEYWPLLKDEYLELFIDSPETPKGDGFAIDFVRLLVNPRNIPRSGVSGKVTDAKTRKPLANAIIKVSGAQQIRTDEKGQYQMDGIPCGMIVVQAAMAGYKSASASTDLVESKKAVVNLKLEPETDQTLQEQLDNKGKVELYGIYFDTDKATIKPESLPTLKRLLALIQQNPGRALEIGGHTDSEGDANYNDKLSQDRAESVLKWLKDNKAETGKLKTKGYGESLPVADNATEAGRALNRRVEIKTL